jgi:outer membrane protein
MNRDIRFVLLVAACTAAQAVGATDLVDVYRDARAFDAQFAAARFALAAGREKLPQGRALVLPTLGLTAGDTASRLGLSPYGTNPVPESARNFYNRNYVLSFSQPLFRAQNRIQYDQSEYQVRQAEATFGQAEQDLIVRVVQAYVDVLGAQETLTVARAQTIAIGEQLAQAKRNFEVGTATITDTHEAQARFDLSSAQEITAQNDLDNKLRALQQITGKLYTDLKQLRTDVKLSPPEPNNIQEWAELAERQGYPVQIQEAATEIAKLAAKFSKAGHYPTIDLVATYGQTQQTGSSITAASSQLNLGSIGVQLALPLYQGGAISSREREAAALYEKSKQDLENARRSIALISQQSYLGVINGIAQVGALEQALVSTQSALDSNKLGYEVGVRINIDVLNAQQQVFTTRRDLALARYNTIVNHFKLRAAAATLKEEDLQIMNSALTQ